MEWQVVEGDAGKKLTHFLQEKLGNHSLKKLKRLLEANCCQVNGQMERFASRRLRRGDRVGFQEREMQKAPLQILYEDNHYRIINKPAGVISEDLQELLVHRLDKDTSGVMVLPKSQEAHDILMAQFRERTVYKHYLAYVDGVPSETKGVIKTMMQNKTAITEWSLERQEKGCALINCYPKTGRTHQIRIHMNELGHPVLGDYHYCRRFATGHRPQRQLLHAAEIRFFHPFKEDLITVRAPVPDDFRL